MLKLNQGHTVTVEGVAALGGRLLGQKKNWRWGGQHFMGAGGIKLL